MNFITNIFSPPTAAKITQNLLQDHQHKLIVAEESAAYHRKMAEYHREGVQRLSNTEIQPT